MQNLFQDRTLKCKDCGQEFIWTKEEQEFFAAKGFKNKPARCKNCRQRNRQKVESEYFRVNCSICGASGDILYKARDPHAQIFCKDCFKTKIQPNLA